MSKEQRNSGSSSILELVRSNSIPLIFIIIYAVCVPISDFSSGYLLNEIVARLDRNAFLVLSLLTPIMAGVGLNFDMILGAMADETGLVFVADWQVWEIPGIILVMIISIPISILLGLFCSKMLNMVEGREMVTSCIISFFVNGLYQLVTLYMTGSITPIIYSSTKLPRGYGVRNMVNLLHMRQYLDSLLTIHIGGVKIPVLTLVIIALLCLFIIRFRETKLGQDMHTVGQDMDVVDDAGIKVERARITTIIISTVFAGLGMVIYLQSMGSISTYGSHAQIGMFYIAVLLVGGASVDRTSISNVFLGAILLHLTFIVAPKAGATITDDSMIDERFRVFISCDVITVALIMCETKKRRAKGKAGRMLQLIQNGEGEN